MLPIAMTVITLALVFYTIGVWTEFRRKAPSGREVAWFAAGLSCDALGTFLMMHLADSGTRVLAPWARDLMAVSGTLAIILMAVHLVLLIVVLRTGWMRERFHLVSLAIWLVWLVSYFAGPLGLMVR